MADRTPAVLTKYEILARLNRALVAEVQAVADYGAHAQACQEPEVREALETLADVEGEHARRLARHIRALGGSPPPQVAAPQASGETLASWLALDLAAEQWAIAEYARMIAGIVDDDETAELMAELLWDEIRHAAWLKSVWRQLRRS